jgi:Mg-chelatase subunit ChlD
MQHHPSPLHRFFALFITLAMLLNSLALSITPARPAQAAQGDAVRVAYFYDNDSASAQSLAGQLNANGFAVQTFQLGESPPTGQPFRILLPLITHSGEQTTAANAPATQQQVPGTLAGFDLVIIGADTGAGGQWEPGEPSGPGLFEEIQASGLPVIAMGAGGHAFLGRLGLPTGHPNGVAGSSAAIQAADLGDSQPFYAGVTLPADNILPLYNEAQNVVSIPLATAPDGGVRLAALAGDAALFPIVGVGRYYLWGFDGGPAAMTDTGRQLLTNLANLAVASIEINLRSRSFVPAPGVDPALAAALPDTTGLHAFAQLTRLPDDAGRAALAEIGIHLVSFVGDTLYIAFVAPTPAADHPTFQDLVRWLGLILPTDKIDPAVQAGAFEEWADNGDGTVKLLVRFHEDISDEAALTVLAQFAGAPVAYSPHTWAVSVAVDSITTLAQQDAVKWIEQGPVPFLPENDTTRGELNVDAAQIANTGVNPAFYAGLDGSGVTVAIFDSGVNTAANTHNDFNGRLVRTALDGDPGGHGSHVAGIVGASGANSVTNCPFGMCSDFQMRGMAPNARLAPYNDGRSAANLDNAVNTHGAEVSNHSYYMTCGAYDADAQGVDEMIRGDGANGGTAIPAHQMVKSAGNSGQSGQYCDAAGYFALTGAAKNLLMVGALNDQSNFDLRSSSSRGPTWDGRLKPDIMGIGCGHSTDNDTQGYISKCGTSMASPSVAGIVALMTEQYHHSFPSAGRPAPSLVRALIIQTATDLIHDPAQPGFAEFGWNDPDTGQPVIYHAGPDYATGYGVANAQRAVAAIRARSFVEGVVSPGDGTDTYAINVPAGTPELKFTLVWDDEPGDPMLAITAAQLVNNLDLTLEGPNGELIRPWVLAALPQSSDLPGGDPDPIVRATHILPATRGVDNLNNTEQVQIANPAAGLWTIRVNAAALPNANSQPYSLAGDFRTLNIVDPQTGNVADGGDPANPNVFPVVLEAIHALDSSVSALTDAVAGDFTVQIGGSNATIISGLPTGDQFWLMVRPPSGVYSAGSKYDLTVTWNGHGADSETRAVLFTEREITDRAVVIDHSGSMSDYDKMASAQNAARLFIDQSLPDDRIAVVSFSTASNVDYATTLVPAADPASVLDAAKNMVNALAPDAQTAIGLGLLDGQAQVTAAPADHSIADVVILLSDGMENVNPYYDTPAVKGVIEPTDTIVHTIGVGPASAGFHALLEEIADDNGGDFLPVNESGGAVMAASASAATATGSEVWPTTLANRLGDVYKQYAEAILDESRIFQVQGMGGTPTGAPHIFNIEVSEGLKRINFSANWALPESQVIFQVIDPDKTVYQYTGKNDPNDPRSLACRGDATHRTCIIEQPKAGTWQMMLLVHNPENEWVAWVSAKTAVNFQLFVGTPERQRIMGEPVHIVGFLSEGEKALAGQSVAVRVFSPFGGYSDLNLYDDGLHGDGAADDGIYANHYTGGNEAGAYAVRGVAKGQDQLGKPFELYKNTGFHLRPRIVYIHRGDLDTAGAYKQLVEDHGVAVDQLEISNVSGADLHKYNLVVIGPETGSLGDWGTDEAVKHILSHEKPVLGLGEGGYAYFGKLNLPIGWPNGAHSQGTTVLRNNMADAIWHYPYEFLVEEQRLWQLYVENSGRVDIFLGDQPAGVEVFGFNDSDGRYADIAMQSGWYMLWGFQDGPKNMTEDGRKLFVNTVYRTMK